MTGRAPPVLPGGALFIISRYLEFVNGLLAILLNR